MGKSILIVEDDAIVAIHIRNMLTTLGYSVTGPVANGADAFLAVATDLPDLILMDIQLAGKLDGITVAERIRSTVDVPIVFLTSHSHETLIQQAKTTLPFGYLIKPASQRELAITIEIALYRHMLEGQLKENRQALQKANEELEQRVQERTAELVLLNERLRREIEDHIESKHEMQKMAMAMEKATDWILITDKSGKIEYVNQAVEEITGYKKEELLGKSPRIFKSGKYSDAFYQEMWNTILSGTSYSAIITNKRKDGRFIEIYHTITPLKDTKGNISHFIATSKDITQQKFLEDKLTYLAYYDVLTDLPNRTLLIDRLHQVIGRAEHNKLNAAVVWIDIDRFTLINDTYGYEIGDQILKEVGRRFDHATQEGDTVARLGADEFGIILSDVTHSEEVVRFVDHLMREAHNPIQVGSVEVILTLSVGISLYPEDGKEMTALLKNADIAMSKAKGTGMNNYQFYKDEMNIRAADFVMLERHLYQAIKENEFILHYQPYYYAQTGELAGIEALLRWDSKDLGIVLPGRFISVLEDTGMIIDLGQWIIQTVCSQLTTWESQGFTTVPVAFNLSAVQFKQKNIGSMIEETIRKCGVDPRYLTCEVTETTFMNDLSHTREVLETLKKIGLRIAIDDFGTGYSSLSYLKRLSLDVLKIDISFIRDIVTSPDDEAIVSAIISLAHNLNLRTIAEGVETAEQITILQRLGCDMIQGFYFSRPIPPHQMRDILKRQAEDIPNSL